jgi:NAD+ synthase (glutamine-hydrolysing)
MFPTEFAGERRLRLGLAQINTWVGRPRRNADTVRRWAQAARDAGVDWLVFPELTLAGYPPEDLLFREDFIRAVEAELEPLAAERLAPVVVVGLPRRGPAGLENAAAVLAGGEVAALYAKQHLPNYGVFDEARYFAPGSKSLLVDWDGWRVGISVCEDIFLADGPWLAEARAGADLLLNLSASPFERDKPRQRDAMLATRAFDAEAYVALCNLVGGQDELVFDGTSAVYGPDGKVVARAPSFEETLLVVDLEPGVARHRRRTDRRWRGDQPAEEAVFLTADPPRHPPIPKPAVTPFGADVDVLRQALVMGLRDYVRKNGFRGVVLGLSGGIDSSVAAALSVEALGADQVHAVFLPSRITADTSREDAFTVAANLGIECRELPIADIFAAMMAVLAPHFGDRPWDATEENLQARIRGTLWMALSNKFGWLVVTTGNKSEMATGYSTLYGDMAGGFSLLKDVYKEDVYRLAQAINGEREIIPARVLTKPPTAELREGQRDEDSLPPYPLLDEILVGYVEQDLAPAELKARGLPPGAVDLAVRLVNRNEYKRRQAPVGVKVSSRAFGRDRRMPITGQFPEEG